MEVVSAEVNSLLPEEIMDTTLVEDDSIEVVAVTSQHAEPIPMETERGEIEDPVQIQNSQVPSSVTDHVAMLTNNATPLILSEPNIKMEVNTDIVSKTTGKGSLMSSTTAGMNVTLAANQILLKPITEPSDQKFNQAIKCEAAGQQLVVTTLGKSRQSIVLSLPPNQASHPQQVLSQTQVADLKQIKVVTLGGRSEIKSIVGASNALGSVQPAQSQMKTVQIAKKSTPTSAAGPVITKFFFTKPVNNKNIIAGHSTTTMKPAVPNLAVGTVNATQFKTIIPLATSPNVQQIQVTGSKFHYVRLVTATTASASPHIASSSINTQPISQAKSVVLNTPVRMSVPIAPAQSIKNVSNKLNAQVVIAQITPNQPQQRLIMPATALPQIQPNLTSLPPGTVLTPAPGTGSMGYAVVPAQYVTQLQQASYVSISSNNGFTATTNIQTQAKLPVNGTSTSESGSRPRKPCNCTKSQCLKLYCDCFANGEFCNNCNCTNCFNNLEHEAERLKAIKACLDRNPEAFKPKIGKGKEGESDRRHSKGCNCKRSGCLKNYCECYEAKIMCSSICKCIGCKNFEESPERKTLMHLADAAEVRVQQQTAAKTKLSSQISDLLTRTMPTATSGGGKLPFTFVTKEVTEATCECLLAKAEEAEKTNKSKAVTERMILEEFGRCLMRIINSAGKAKGDSCALSC
uniref:Lin-54 DREAM MuvB core complex component n=1 Tax=Callorhinchus milii TaxID=7868 RepID=A0A4W3HSU2_CALMI